MGLFPGSTELRADGNPRLLRWLCSGGVNTQNLDTQTGEFTRACLPVELLVAQGGETEGGRQWVGSLHLYSFPKPANVSLNPTVGKRQRGRGRLAHFNLNPHKTHLMGTLWAGPQLCL